MAQEPTAKFELREKYSRSFRMGSTESCRNALSSATRISPTKGEVASPGSRSEDNSSIVRSMTSRLGFSRAFRQSRRMEIRLEGIKWVAKPCSLFCFVRLCPKLPQRRRSLNSSCFERLSRQGKIRSYFAIHFRQEITGSNVGKVAYFCLRHREHRVFCRNPKRRMSRQPDPSSHYTLTSLVPYPSKS